MHWKSTGSALGVETWEDWDDIDLDQDSGGEGSEKGSELDKFWSMSKEQNRETVKVCFLESVDHRSLGGGKFCEWAWMKEWR